MNARSSPALRRVLMDSSAYYALTTDRDPNHAAAYSILTRFARESPRLFTTNLIVAETHALLLARLGHATAVRFLTELDRSSTVLIRVSAKDEQRARAIIYQYDDEDFSLTEATSFAVMERLHIAHAFAFDHHFTQFGVTILGPIP